MTGFIANVHCEKLQKDWLILHWPTYTIRNSSNSDL